MSPEGRMTGSGSNNLHNLVVLWWKLAFFLEFMTFRVYNNGAMIVMTGVMNPRHSLKKYLAPTMVNG